MPKTQDLIKPKLDHYLKATWRARWIVIAIVTGSFLFLPNINDRLVGALVVIATVYNTLLWMGNKAGVAFVSNRVFTIVTDSILTVMLTACTGGTLSPYLAILVLIIVSGSYWYGPLAAIIIGLLQLVVIEAFDLLSKIQTFPKTFVVQVAIFITMGVYMAWLSQSERSERSELIALGNKSEKERQQLLALINNMDDAVLVISTDGAIMLYNHAAELLLGDIKTLQKQPLKDFLKLTDGEDQPVELKLKRLSAAYERKDLRLKAHDGSSIFVAVSVAPYIANRQNQGSVLIIQDITQDKTISQEREEFIAVASHELRTPLTIAQGELSLLSQMPLPEGSQSVTMLNTALRSLQQLSHIISDLTNLSQVENRQLPIKLEPLDPAALLKDFEADFADQAKAKSVKLTINTESAGSLPTVLTSGYVVREILTVFMTNAMKFTEEGSITLAVQKPADNAQGVTFSVSDTGIGISSSDQKKIFEKFFQSEDYNVRVHGGTGLGLYIAKRLADRLTAKVWFETDLHKGSTFYLWVPPYSQDKSDQAKVASAETKDFFSGI